MSRTGHSQHARYRTHVEWFAKNVKYERPAWAERRQERSEVERELVDMDLAVWDPEVLLWGGLLATPKDTIRREWRRWNAREPFPNQRSLLDGYYDAWEVTDRDWRDCPDEYADRHDWYYDLADEYSCPCCDSYVDEDRYGYRGWSWDGTPDLCSAEWRDEWVAGRVDAPWERDSYEDMWYWPGDEECQGCGELHEYCKWSEYCQILASDWCEAEAVPSDTTANLGAVRDRERQAAAFNARRRIVRRR